MSSTTVDPGLYLKMSAGELEGLVVIYVDDNLHAVNDDSEETALDYPRRFDSNPLLHSRLYLFAPLSKR